MHIPKTTFGCLAVALLCIASAAAARADTIAFTGSRDTVNGPPAAPAAGRCGSPAPPNLLVTLAGTGTSTLGSFAAADSHCANVATGVVSDGRFAWDFGAGNTLLGTFVGTATLPPVMGVAPFSETFAVTGGTGLFAGATGLLSAAGTLSFNPNGTVNTHADFTGTINTVPEPATMVLLGMGLAGFLGAARRRGSRVNG